MSGGKGRRKGKGVSRGRGRRAEAQVCAWGEGVSGGIGGRVGGGRGSSVCMGGGDGGGGRVRESGSGEERKCEWGERLGVEGRVIGGRGMGEGGENV